MKTGTSTLIHAASALLFSLAFSSPASAVERPNVLFLFTDDQSHDTVGALGNPSIQTPHIDHLVRRGVAFTNAYIMGGSSPAVCSASRASLFSGRSSSLSQLAHTWLAYF